MITGYTGGVTLPMLISESKLTSECKQPQMLSEIPKIGFRCNIKIYETALNGLLQLI